MSTMSNSPTRWLVPPPIRTAYFSSSRQPGVVLRVSRIFDRQAGHGIDELAGQGGHAGEPLEEVQGRPLGHQDRPHRPLDGGERLVGPDPVAVLPEGGELELRIDPQADALGGLEPGQHAGGRGRRTRPGP